MASQWFVNLDGEEMGPITSEQLKDLVGAGHVTPKDFVRKEGKTTWVQARQIKGLFPAIQPTPSPSQVQEPEPVLTPVARPVQQVQGAQSPAQGSNWKSFLVVALAIIPVMNGVRACSRSLAQKSGTSIIVKSETAAERPSGQVTVTSQPQYGVKIEHDPFTHITMPELPAQFVHDTEDGELEKDIGEVIVPDISKVDFLKGANGEPVEMVKYWSEGPDRFLRQYGYLYRNKAGRNVYHGPWYVFFSEGKKRSETIYIHGAMKCSQEWDLKGDSLLSETFKGDGDHTQFVKEYYDNGGYRFVGGYEKVRYVREGSGYRVERTPSGHHLNYYEQNGNIRQHEVFENGERTGIAVFDLWGKQVLGRGSLSTQ